MKTLISTLFSLIALGSCKSRDASDLEDLKCPVVVVANSNSPKDSRLKDYCVVVLSTGDGRLIRIGAHYESLGYSEAAVAISLSRNVGDTLVKCK